MCGIAGIVSARAVETGPVETMIRCLRHRGPDESGFWSGAGVALGHQRLSVIDLSPTGSQPMVDEQGRHVVVFNGEIFNFRRLRDELQGMGLTFRGSSDTEVILKGYQVWGHELPAKLLGMFAFAIWDAERKSLFVARDRYGKKPLYYAADESRFVFASELQALLSGLPSLPEINREGFASYMRFGYLPAATTPYHGIHRLAPAHSLTWENGKIQIRSYHGWPPNRGSSPSSGREEGVLLDNLHEILRSAVADRLVSDVPLGCFLSGGVDSSLIVALARQLAGPELKTFTVSFPGTPRDEGARASKIARVLGTSHRQLELSEEEMESGYLETLRLTTEPIGDDSFIPTYFISRATREHVTVALSGDGGDELFGGYPKYRQIKTAAFFHPLSRILPQAFDHWLPDQATKALQVSRKHGACARALWLGSLWKQDELDQLLADPAWAKTGRQFFDDEWIRCAGGCLQDQFSLVDIATYLEGDILTKVDRASMAVSLEVRSPLLDERVLDFTCATELRCSPLGRSKLALRKLLARYLDPRIFQGPKKGFGLPIDEWLRGRLRPVLEEYTSASRLGSGGLVDSDYVAKIRSEHLSGKRNYGRKLHALIAWEVWRETVSRADS